MTATARRRVIHLWFVDDDELIETAAAEAAAMHVAFDVTPWAGLMLFRYEPLYTTVWGMPDGVGPEYELDSDIMGDLEELPNPDSPAWQELAERVDGDDWVLAAPYYLALARHLRRLTGLPTLVYDADMPYAEQLARQTVAAGVEDPLSGLDVLVSHRVDALRVAVVYRDHTGRTWASGRYGFDDPEPFGRSLGPGLDQPKHLGSDPAILASTLPAGAADVAVRVGRGPWTKPNQINRGVWICALNAREVTYTPQLVYYDAEGVEFAITVPLDGPEAPSLWPTQAPSSGRLAGRGSGGKLLEGGDWEVNISNCGPFETAAEVLAEDVGVHEAEILSRPIPGSVLGHRHGFELASRDGRWLAVAECGGFAIIVRATGELPARLDLELFRPV